MSLQQAFAPLLSQVEDYRRQLFSPTEFTLPGVATDNGSPLLRLGYGQVEPLPATHPWSNGEAPDLCGNPSHPAWARAAQVIITRTMQLALLLAICVSLAALPFIVVRESPGLFQGHLFVGAMLFALLPLFVLLEGGRYLLETLLSRVRALFAGPVTLRWRGGECVATQRGQEVEIAVGQPVALELVDMAPTGQEVPEMVKLALVDGRGQAFHLAAAEMAREASALDRQHRWEKLRRSAGAMAVALGGLDLRITRVRYDVRYVEDACGCCGRMVWKIADVASPASC